MEETNYEKAVERLEKIADKLENGNLSLEEMMRLYEEGTGIAAYCADALDSAELKITELSAARSDKDD